jgi:hypothetical protein
LGSPHLAQRRCHVLNPRSWTSLLPQRAQATPSGQRWAVR